MHGGSIPVPALTSRRAAALVLVFLAESTLGTIAAGARPSGHLTGTVICSIAFFALGLLAWRQRPANATGSLMVVTALLLVVPVWRFGVLPEALTTVGWLAAGNPGLAALAAVVLAFPFGRLQARVDRVLIALIAVNTTVWYWMSLPFRGGPACQGCPDDTNGLGFAADQQVADAFTEADAWFSLALAIAVVLRLGMHWRRFSLPARHSAAPLLVSGSIAAGAVALQNFVEMPWGVYWALVSTIAVGLLAGVLRTRLTRSNLGDLVIALRNDPQPEALEVQLSRALGDPSLKVAFEAPDGYVDTAGRTFDVPVDGPDRAVTRLGHAILVHDPVLREDVGLVDAVAAAAALSLENARLQAQVRAQLEEVRASRQRIVEAADAERRRIERDLHDGAQQRLLGLALSLRLLRQELGEGAPATEALVDQAMAEAQGALVEMRELARGIHPPVLSNDGLGPALESLAEHSPIPVRLAALPERRLSAAVEVAAWFVVGECVANAAKHAHAAEVVVTVLEEDHACRLTVRDDGVGGARIEGSGVGGLSGLRDRVEALGGAVSISSPVGRGTVVRARIPLEQRAPAEA